MRKFGVCAIAAALLVAAGGMSEAKSAQAATLPVKGYRIDCSAIKGLAEKLQQMNISCETLHQWLPGLPCLNQPGGNGPTVPNQPETPKPELPDVDVPVIPDVPELPDQTPEQAPETDNTAYAYGLRITELVNEHRKAAGLAPVTYSAKLSAAAQVRAVEIEKSFSHTRPDGRYFSTVFAEHGITYRYSGENIAWGQRSPEEVVTAWMNSAGHRANILNANFKELGVGYRQNARGVNYFTQLFIY